MAQPTYKLPEIEVATSNDFEPTTTAPAAFDCQFRSDDGYLLELIALTEEQFPGSIADAMRSHVIMKYLQKGELIVSSILRVKSGVYVSAKKSGASFTVEMHREAGSTARIICNATGESDHFEFRVLSGCLD